MVTHMMFVFCLIALSSPLLSSLAMNLFLIFSSSLLKVLHHSMIFRYTSIKNIYQEKI